MDGELSVSRSIGDLPFVNRGLIAVPSLSAWINTVDDSHHTGLPTHLILATDGLFEPLTPADICKAAAAFTRGELPCNWRAI